MSTADNMVGDLALPHPDSRLMARVRAALDHWNAHPAAATPTSSVLGTGAIAAVEAAVSAQHNNIPALLLPSATYGLRVAMAALGVGPGDDVLLPALDWPASYAAASSLGARPIPVPVDPDTLTIDPSACVAAVTDRTRTVVACHLHGVCADIPALRLRLPQLSVIEDCAAALGSTLDGRRAGTMGDVAVLSFGPGKQLDAGEAGVLLASTESIYRRALTLTAHPLRGAIIGLEPDPATLTMRPHPLAAILALEALTRWDPHADEQAHRRLAESLSADANSRVIGYDERRTNAGTAVPILISGPEPAAAAGRSGAVELPVAQDVSTLHDLVSRVRVVAVETPTARVGE